MGPIAVQDLRPVAQEEVVQVVKFFVHVVHMLHLMALCQLHLRRQLPQFRFQALVLRRRLQLLHQGNEVVRRVIADCRDRRAVPAVKFCFREALPGADGVHVQAAVKGPGDLNFTAPVEVVPIQAVRVLQLPKEILVQVHLLQPQVCGLHSLRQPVRLLLRHALQRLFPGGGRRLL